MSVPSYLFHSLLVKLLNKGMGFTFPPLKLPNKGREEYSKMIRFIPFHSIPSFQKKPKCFTLLDNCILEDMFFLIRLPKFIGS